MRLSNELQIGKAGEYLVCADLIMKGFIAFPSEQGLPYDVLLDNGEKLLRVQVKTCEKPRIIPQRSKETFAYQFNIKRHGKNGRCVYGDDEVDIFALVALDTRCVGYLNGKDIKTTINFRVDSLRGSYYDEKGIRDYEKVLSTKKTFPGKKQTEIARELGLNIATVNRMLQPGYSPFVTGARYFSDISRGKEWFMAF